MCKKTDVIHLMMSFDKGYITPLFVLLTSLFHNNEGCVFNIHSVARISTEEKNKISKFVQAYNNEIFFYEVDTKLVDSFVLPYNKETHLTSDTYNRLFIPDLIPSNIKRILHIDIDTVVVGKLEEVYRIDMGSFPVAAVPDAGAPARPELGIYASEDYFNAGVLLIDIAEWKKQKISEKAIEVIVNYPDLVQRFVDQDALNFVLKGNWCKMDKRFNLMGMYSPKDLSFEAQDEYLQDKIVIHFNGPKPWNFFGDCDHRFAYLYHAYRILSPIKNDYKYLDVNVSKKFFKKAFNKFVYLKVLDFYLKSPILTNVWRKLKK